MAGVGPGAEGFARSERTVAFFFIAELVGLTLLQKIGIPDVLRLRQRVATELKTTFASHYTREVSLVEMLDLDVIAAYNRRATGEKFLLTPQK